jgi:hypothetical protein
LRRDALPQEQRRRLADAAVSDRWGRFAPFAMPLQLCLLRDDLMSGAPDAARSAVQSLDGLLLQPEEAKSSWPAAEIYTAGVLALHGHRDELFRQDKDFAPTKSAIAGMIYRAFDLWGQDDDADTAEAALVEILDVCGKAAGPQWCLSVLKDGLERFGKPTWYMLVDLGTALARQGSAEDARLALTLFDRGEHARGSSLADTSRRGEWLGYGRAQAHLSLVAAGMEEGSHLQTIEDRLSHLDRDLRRTREDRIWPPVTELLLQAADLAHHAEVAVRTMSDQSRDASEFTNWKFALLVAHGQLAEAKDALKSVTNPDLPDWLFYRGIAEFLAGTPDAKHVLRQVVEQHNQSETYARLLMYVVLTREGDQEGARKILIEGRTGINMSTTFDRMQDGDITPWHEMLVQYYLDGGRGDKFWQLRGMIGDAQTFPNSPLGRTSQSRSEFLTDLYFYDAMLQSVTGDPETRTQRERDDLQQVLDCKGVMTLESAMAGYLLPTLEPRR